MKEKQYTYRFHTLSYIYSIIPAGKKLLFLHYFRRNILRSFSLALLFPLIHENYHQYHINEYNLPVNNYLLKMFFHPLSTSFLYDSFSMRIVTILRSVGCHAFPSFTCMFRITITKCLYFIDSSVPWRIGKFD
jgi:hypothetical protein